MLHKHTVEIEWAGRPLRLETGRIARQADGAVLAQYGGTSVLATATAAKQARVGIDFLPLTVNYQEKTFAAGKIPGGYFKREGRPTEKETLTSRLIDRPIRPLFAEGDASYSIVDNDGGTVYMVTDKGAPRSQLVAFDIASPSEWRVVVPESKDNLTGAGVEVSEAEIRAEIELKTVEARRQLIEAME